MDALIGSDIPGSVVSICVKKANGEVRHVELTRVSSAKVVDQRQMVAHFDALKRMAAQVLFRYARCSPMTALF